MFFGFSLPSVQKYHFHFVQCFISVFLFTMHKFVHLFFFPSWVESTILHQLWLYVFKYLHTSKSLLSLLPNLTFLSYCISFPPSILSWAMSFCILSSGKLHQQRIVDLTSSAISSLLPVFFSDFTRPMKEYYLLEFPQMLQLLKSNGISLVLLAVCVCVIPSLNCI